MKKIINDIQRKIKDAYLIDDFDAMEELNGQMLKLASKLMNPKHVQAVTLYYQKVNRILTQRQLYTAMMSQILDIFRPQSRDTNTVDDKSLRLQILEEEFQNAFFHQDFRLCLGKIPEILELAKMRQDKGKIEYYSQLREPFELAAKQQSEILQTPQKAASQDAIMPKSIEKLQKIEDLKKMATECEERLDFRQAKAIYQEMMQVATAINDRLVIALCDQMIAQIGIWEEEIEKSDFTKLDIPPFRLLNRARFDCLEALSEKGAANRKMENLVTLGVKPENIKVITISRSRFRGITPYNKNGECYAIYIRRSLDL